jgi:ketosteroid isomerase-like protein
MADGKAAVAATHPNGDDLIAMVERFMLASMAGDRETTDALLAPGAVIVFTGGRRFGRPDAVAAFNALRYASVKKNIERYDVAPADGETVVYCTGTLAGAWPDGTPFEGNRFVDRFVVRDGRITRMDVWNDSAEILLRRAGLAEDAAG